MSKKTLTIGIAGYARTGKDTFADLVTEMVGSCELTARFKFAEMVRRECARLYPHLAADMWTEDPSKKEIIREKLLEVGAGYRDKNPNVWIEHLAEIVPYAEEPIRLIPDARYLNEVKWILDNGGIVVLLHRDKTGPLNQEEHRMTSKLYDSRTNPFAAMSNFRPYYWGYELTAVSHLAPEIRREREKQNILATIPELEKWCQIKKQKDDLANDLIYKSAINQRKTELA